MSEAAQIDRFVRRLGWRHRWLSAARIALRLGLPIGCVAFVVAAVAPGHGLQVLVVGIALVLAVGAGTLATTRLRAARADTELALADRLPTWEEVRRQESHMA